MLSSDSQSKDTPPSPSNLWITLWESEEEVNPNFPLSKWWPWALPFYLLWTSGHAQQRASTFKKCQSLLLLKNQRQDQSSYEIPHTIQEATASKHTIHPQSSNIRSDNWICFRFSKMTVQKLKLKYNEHPPTWSVAYESDTVLKKVLG